MSLLVLSPSVTKASAEPRLQSSAATNSPVGVSLRGFALVQNYARLLVTSTSFVKYID